MSVLNDARSKSNIRSQAYLLAVNEKYNIRAKYNSNDMKSMTNGQLNSFYNKSYMIKPLFMNINTDYKSEFYSDLRWNFNTNSNSKWYIDRIK